MQLERLVVHIKPRPIAWSRICIVLQEEPDKRNRTIAGTVADHTFQRRSKVGLIPRVCEAIDIEAKTGWYLSTGILSSPLTL